MHVQQQQQCVVTAGADKSVKLWQLLQRLPQQQPAAESTVADVDPAAVTSTDATATAAAAAAAEDTGTAVTLPPPEVQLAAAAAAAVRQPTGGGGSWQQGKHSSMYYGAVALLPGSVMSDGSCMMLMTGMAGGVLLAAMVPGRRHAYVGAVFAADMSQPLHALLPQGDVWCSSCIMCLACMS
jgi:hypothetical protein